MENRAAGVGGDVVAWGAAALVGAAVVLGGLSYFSNAPSAFASPPITVERQTPAADADTGAEGSEEEGSASASADTDELKKAPSDTVRPIAWGDTLTDISRETGVSVDRLAEYNSIADVDVIYADSALRVPYVLVPAEGGDAQ